MNLIFVTVLGDSNNVPIQNKVALKVNAEDNEINVGKQFAEEIRVENNLKFVSYEIYKKFNQYYALIFVGIISRRTN